MRPAKPISQLGTTLIELIILVVIVGFLVAILHSKCPNYFALGSLKSTCAV